MFSNQAPTKSSSELQRTRKRAHESVTNPRSKRQREKIRYRASEALDLASLFHELSIFDEEPERIYVKDTIGQEFIDRIGKLYKPVLIEQNSNQTSMNERLTVVDVSKNKTNEIFPKHKLSNNNKLLIDYDIIALFLNELLKHCSAELLLPFSTTEDISESLAIRHLGEAFANNVSLSRILSEYIRIHQYNDEWNGWKCVI